MTKEEFTKRLMLAKANKRNREQIKASEERKREHEWAAFNGQREDRGVYDK